MNRELKLALIIGFSLVLLVTVLISDHLSAARQATLAGVEPTKPLAAVDPTSQAFLSFPETAPGAAEPEVAPPMSAPADRLAAPGLDAGTNHPGVGESLARGAGEQAPVEFSQATRVAAADAGLVEAIYQLGGSVVQSDDGVREIRVNAPPALAAGAAGPAMEPEDAEIRHVVASGEALYDIAKKYYGAGSKWTLIREANPDRISSTGVVRAGVTIKIPALASTGPAPAPAPADRVREPRPRQPEARPAPQPRSRGPVEVAETQRPQLEREAPPVRPQTRTASRPTDGPRSTESKPAAGAPGRGTYVVRRGDTLGEIAQRVLGSTQRKTELMKLNGIDDEDTIRVGAVLKLPQ